MTEQVWSEKDLVRRANRRLAVLQHAEEVSGSVAATCRYYGVSRTVFYRWRRRRSCWWGVRSSSSWWGPNRSPLRRLSVAGPGSAEVPTAGPLRSLGRWFAIDAAVRGYGPFAGDDLLTNMITLQLYNGSVALRALPRRHHHRKEPCPR